MPGGDQHIAVVVEADVGRMVEVDGLGIVAGRVAQIAGAGEGLDDAVLDAANPMVVPVENVQQAIRTVSGVLRQVELGRQRRLAVVVQARDAGAGDGVDGRRRAPGERRIHGQHKIADGDGAFKFGVELRADADRCAAERDVDTLQQLADDHLPIPVAVAAAGRHRPSKQEGRAERSDR